MHCCYYIIIRISLTTAEQKIPLYATLESAVRNAEGKNKDQRI